MNVTCIKSTSKLVKGATYKVASYTNVNTKGYSFFKPTIRIYLTDNSIHTFHLDYFEPTGGGSFSQISWICPDYKSILDERDQMKIDRNLKAGDYVIPTHDGLKTLVQGKKYKVVDVKILDHKSSTGHISWTDITVQLEGSKRYYAGYNFRKCTSQEAREISLKTLFDEKTDTEKVNKHKRKFDYFTEEEKSKLLIKFILTSSNDRSRNKMDIIDWTIEKTAKHYSLKRGDFEMLRGKEFLDCLDLI